METCTILTTDANDLVRTIHNRMPLIIGPDDYRRWVDPQVQDPASVRDLLRPFPGENMIAYPVSRLVNNPRNDDAKCLEPSPKTGAREGEQALLF